MHKQILHKERLGRFTIMCSDVENLKVYTIAGYGYLHNNDRYINKVLLYACED